MHCTSVQINTRQSRLCKKWSSPHGKSAPWLHFLAPETACQVCMALHYKLGQHWPTWRQGKQALELQAPPGLPIIVKRYSTCPPQVIARLVVRTGNVATHWASCSALATKEGHG